MCEKIWSDDAWDDYLFWQAQDRKMLKRINQLIKDIERNGCREGLGKPEALTGDLQGALRRQVTGGLSVRCGEIALHAFRIIGVLVI